mmetsp:Transcript_26336/g.34251  ORF Transcript_26336/g.34251 Transcript_26336/m.34251 type:complete len:456 (+) Transcript_26336:79-1446(+)
MRCWRCAKENQEGVPKCVVCASELNRKVEPWFCRTCFRRCLQESCSLCGSGRTAGVLAAAHAANMVISREVTSKLRSRRYAKWITTGATTKHSSTKKSRVINIENVSIESDRDQTKNDNDNNVIENGTSELESQKHTSNLSLSTLLTSNDKKDQSSSFLLKTKQSLKKILTQEEFVALLWDAFQIVSIQPFLSLNNQNALRITSSIASLLPHPPKLLLQQNQNVEIPNQINQNLDISLNNENENKNKTVDDISLKKTNTRTRRNSKEDLAKKEDKNMRQRKASLIASNLAALALEQSRLPTPITTRHWFLLMKRSHFQKYSFFNRFLFNSIEIKNNLFENILIQQSYERKLNIYKNTMKKEGVKHDKKKNDNEVEVEVEVEGDEEEEDERSRRGTSTDFMLPEVNLDKTTMANPIKDCRAGVVNGVIHNAFGNLPPLITTTQTLDMNTKNSNMNE